LSSHSPIVLPDTASAAAAAALATAVNLKVCIKLSSIQCFLYVKHTAASQRSSSAFALGKPQQRQVQRSGAPVHDGLRCPGVFVNSIALFGTQLPERGLQGTANSPNWKQEDYQDTRRKTCVRRCVIVQCKSVTFGTGFFSSLRHRWEGHSVSSA
jgi:hypothetical protein